MPYVPMLWNGATLPHLPWEALEREIARSCNASVPELRAVVGTWDTGYVPRDSAELCCGCISRLWWQVWQEPPTRLCTRRWRRHTARTFLPLERWTAELPDVPGGFSLP
jgi:hypothetical protein